MGLSGARALGTAIALAATAAVVAPSIAWARFDGGASAALAVGSGSLTAPSAVTTDNKCTYVGPGDSTFTVSWTASDPHATGYVVALVPATGSAISRTVSGASTASVTVDVVPNLTYTVTVTSRVGNWTAASPGTAMKCNGKS